MTQEAYNIETREIRGLNVKVMITIVGAVITSTIAIIMTINGLKTELLKLQNIQDKQYEITDLKLRTLDIRVTAIELEQRQKREDQRPKDD